MEVELSVCLENSGRPTVCTTSSDGKTIALKAPKALMDMAIPSTDISVSTDHVYGASSKFSAIYEEQLKDMAQNIVMKSQNSVVYAYGQKALPKREFLFGSAPVSESLSEHSGVMQHVLRDLFAQPTTAQAAFKIYGFVMGVADSIADLLHYGNAAATVADSVKDGPVISNLTKLQIRSYAEGVQALQTIAKSVQEEFLGVLDESRSNDPIPPYHPGACIVGILKYDTPEDLERDVESNSLHFIAMGDCERPPLCGVNLDHLTKYEKTQKSHSAWISVLAAIRGNRLRVPLTKCKLTSLLRRAYNTEKNNPRNDVNAPTRTFAFMWIFDDDAHVEESFHTLTATKRIVHPTPGGVGPASRDLGLERWRLELDIVELKDELAIAKAVHDYKPCIFEQAKPVQNVQEKEFERITAINKKRDEARARAQAEMRQQAQQEAQAIIQQEEQTSSSTCNELEERLKTKLAANAELAAERERKVREFDKQLDKIKKKRVEEEEKTQKLREEIVAIEEELAGRQQAIDKAQGQLKMITVDGARGRELILQNRESSIKNREEIYAQRRAKREQWLSEVEVFDKKVLEQVQLLSKERPTVPVLRPESAPISEQEIVKDIEEIRRFIPVLLDLDNPRIETAASENVRLQLEEYFENERRTFEKKLTEEEQRRREMEDAVEVYKARLQEYQVRLKKDQVLEAIRKEKHLQGLVEQVIQYLEHGCLMTHIPPKGHAKKRYFYLGEGRKKLCYCEPEDLPNVTNRRKLPTVVMFKDIRRVVLGQYTPTFDHFCKGHKRAVELRDEEGAFNPDNTEAIDPAKIGKYFYRSLSFEFRKGKTLDLVAETDSDFEAWTVVLRRLLGTQAEWEKVWDDKTAAAAEPPPLIEWGEPLALAGRPGADALTEEERSLCAINHITPMQLLTAKAECQKAPTPFITVYDVRTLSSLDLPRAHLVHEYFLAHNLIPKCPAAPSD